MSTPPEVPLSLYAENRQRLGDAIRNDNTVPDNTFVLLQGGAEIMRYDTDQAYLFRQDAWLLWAFGVREPDFYAALEVTGERRSILFAPRLPDEYATWMGPIKTKEDLAAAYGVDVVYYVDELLHFFETNDTKRIMTLKGVNSDSGAVSVEATFEGIEEFEVDNTELHAIMSELRVIKTPAEIEVLRHSCAISSEAHCEVLRSCQPGMTEYQLESVFRHYIYYHGGARHTAYDCICCSGENGAILHYGHAGAPNEKMINDGDMCLFDMGADYHGYCADITVSFPANGTFSDKQRLIYNAVLAAQTAVNEAMRPGVNWVDMHRLAERHILEHLLAGGLLNGDVDEMLEARVGGIFMPHGLGHMLGLATHDVGGYPTGVERPEGAGISKLRTARVLEEGMVLTNEPGCYFIDWLLDSAAADEKLAPFLNMEAINEFRGFGGIRLEDDVVVTADGIENLTQVPRTIEEVEATMAQSPGAEPELVG